MRIAVVHNTSKDLTINRFGKLCPESYALKTVSKVVEALRDGGYTVQTIAGDKQMFSELESFMPPEDSDEQRQPTGIAFNMAYGIQGECRYTHVPAMLEMAGVPYTGSSPLGHALALDKVVTKQLIASAGVRTPAFAVMHGPGAALDGLRFPLVVKPRHESTSYGLALVHNQAELDRAVEAIVEHYQQAALVEEYIDGREICIGLLGNEVMEILPAVELDFGERSVRLMTWEDKYHRRADEPEKRCPALLDDDLYEEIKTLAVATFKACHCRDYARVDFRIDCSGRPYVLEINSMASLGEGGSFVKAALAAGYSYAGLLQRIVEVTLQRYSGAGIPQWLQAPEQVGLPAQRLNSGSARA